MGGAPYKSPCEDDASFNYIVNGKIVELLEVWDKLEFVTSKALDLIARIFQKEEHRLNIDEIKKHPWLL